MARTTSARIDSPIDVRCLRHHVALPLRPLGLTLTNRSMVGTRVGEAVLTYVEGGRDGRHAVK